MPYDLQRKPDHTNLQLRAEPEKGSSREMRSLASLGFDAASKALAPVQQEGGKGGMDAASVQRVAQTGVSGSGQQLPHLGAIQSAFGRHDVGSVRAHGGSNASSACAQMGAQAYASGNAVAFKGQPDLHTAAHEAAHIVQQRAGVSLKGGVGQSGDTYEKHADQVADAVVQGKSAEGLLDRFAGKGGGAAEQQKPIQMKGGRKSKEGGESESGPPDKTTKKRTAKKFASNIVEGIEDSNLNKTLKRGKLATEQLYKGDGEGNSIWSLKTVKNRTERQDETKSKLKIFAMRAGMAIGLTLFPTFTLTMAMVGNTISTNRKHKRDKAKKKNVGLSEEKANLKVDRLKNVVNTAVSKADLSQFEKLGIDKGTLENMLLSRLELGGSQPRWSEEAFEAYYQIEESIRKSSTILDKAFTEKGILLKEDKVDEGQEIDLDSPKNNTNQPHEELNL